MFKKNAEKRRMSRKELLRENKELKDKFQEISAKNDRLTGRIYEIDHEKNQVMCELEEIKSMQIGDILSAKGYIDIELPGKRKYKPGEVLNIISDILNQIMDEPLFKKEKPSNKND